MIKFLKLALFILSYQMLMGQVPSDEKQLPEDEKVYFTTGLKLGEVTDHSVIILTRLCKYEVPNPIVHEQEDSPFRQPIDFNDSIPINEMDGAVEGVFGQVQINLLSEKDTITGPWKYVSPYKDYTYKAVFNELDSNTDYKVIIFGRKK